MLDLYNAYLELRYHWYVFNIPPEVNFDNTAHGLIFANMVMSRIFYNRVRFEIEYNKAIEQYEEGP